MALSRSTQEIESCGLIPCSEGRPLQLPASTRPLASALIGVFAAAQVLAGCSPRSLPGPVHEKTDCSERPAEFGIWAVDASGELHFVPSDTVPNVEDQPYGWRVQVGDSQEAIPWTETMTLPEVPDSWEGVDEDSTVQVLPDGRTSVTRRTTVPEDGYIGNTWYVALGDPPGEYQMIVAWGEACRGTFLFIVSDPPLPEDSPYLQTLLSGT